MPSKKERIEQLGRRLEEDAAKFRAAAEQIRDVAASLKRRDTGRRAWLEQIARGLDLHSESLTNEIANPNHRLIRLLGGVGRERATLTSHADRLAECSTELIILVDDIDGADPAPAPVQPDVPDQYPDTSPPLTTEAERNVEPSPLTVTAKVDIPTPTVTAVTGTSVGAAATGESTAQTIPIPPATLRLEGATPDVTATAGHASATLAAFDATATGEVIAPNAVTGSMAWTEEDDSTTLDVDSATHSHTADDVELTTDNDG